MSSNFWTSSHSLHWLTSRSQLQSSRQLDLRYATPRQLYCLNIWFANLIQKLGKRLVLRQIPIATATVFFRRFYLKNSLCETNPYLVLAACCFVAAKVEETPVHIKSVVSEAKLVFAEHNIKMFPGETNKLGEMEFYLLEDLDFHLVVFHPYRSLLHMTGREPADSGRFSKTRVDEDNEMRKGENEAKRKREEERRKLGGKALEELGGGAYEESEEARIRRLMGRGSGEGLMEIDESVLQICLFLINDTYRTDIHLLYPPYMIALATLYIGLCLTSMNNPAGTRTRSSSSQITSFSGAVETNADLGLPHPPSTAAEFIASFQISLPVLLACVQDIIVLYPIWESFEPGAGGLRQTLVKDAAAAPAMKAAPAESKEKFLADGAEALVRKMIEDRMVDTGHPDNAGQTAEATGRPGSSGSMAGRKRPRA